MLGTRGHSGVKCFVAARRVAHTTFTRRSHHEQPHPQDPCAAQPARLRSRGPQRLALDAPGTLRRGRPPGLPQRQLVAGRRLRPPAYRPPLSDPSTGRRGAFALTATPVLASPGRVPLQVATRESVLVPPAELPGVDL